MNSNEDLTAPNEILEDLDFREDEHTLDLTNLTNEEIEEITQVLEREKVFRQEEKNRERHLEECLKKKFMEISSKNIDDGKDFCFICANKFRFLIRRRQICSSCEKGICNDCTHILMGDLRICYCCYFEKSQNAKAGKWFTDATKSSGRRRMSAFLLIFKTLKRKKSKAPAPPTPSSNVDTLSIPEIKIESQISIPDPKPSKGHSKHHKDILTAPDKRHLDDTDFHYGSNDGQKDHLGPNLLEMKSLSGSSASIVSDVYESYNRGITITGDVCFSTFYDADKSKLIVSVNQCRNLPIAEKSKRETNPYVKIYLLPDKHKSTKRKTKSLKKNFNPVFNEHIVYDVKKDILHTLVLSVEVWHKPHSLHYNYFLGGIEVPLSTVNLTQPELNWYPLHDKKR